MGNLGFPVRECSGQMAERLGGGTKRRAMKTKARGSCELEPSIDACSRRRTRRYHLRQPFIGGACFVHIKDRKTSAVLKIDYDKASQRLKLPEHVKDVQEAVVS